MYIESKSCDPAIHAAAVKMARAFVNIIGSILMDQERGIALNEAYRVAQKGLEDYRDRAASGGKA